MIKNILNHAAGAVAGLVTGIPTGFLRYGWMLVDVSTSDGVRADAGMGQIPLFFILIPLNILYCMARGFWEGLTRGLNAGLFFPKTYHDCWKRERAEIKRYKELCNEMKKNHLSDPEWLTENEFRQLENHMKSPVVQQLNPSLKADWDFYRENHVKFRNDVGALQNVLKTQWDLLSQIGNPALSELGKNNNGFRLHYSSFNLHAPYIPASLNLKPLSSETKDAIALVQKALLQIQKFLKKAKIRLQSYLLVNNRLGNLSLETVKANSNLLIEQESLESKCDQPPSPRTMIEVMSERQERQQLKICGR